MVGASLSEETKADNATIVKVHFRMSDGSGVARPFLSSEKLQSVFNFAITLRSGPRYSPSSFALASLNPRRKFTDAEMEHTLEELGLVPAALLLLIPSNKH